MSGSTRSVQRQKCEADHSLPPNAEDNERSYTSTLPHVPLWCAMGLLYLYLAVVSVYTVCLLVPDTVSCSRQITITAMSPTTGAQRHFLTGKDKGKR
jgi:hypothetical protein